MRINERKIGVLLILLGLAGLVRGWFQWQGPSASSLASRPEVAASQHPTACKVLTVYDGDTLGCDLNHDGRIQRPHEVVRLLGVDTPEMHYSRKNPTHKSEHPVDEPFAKAASQWMTEQVQGATIYLVFDRRRTDKYNRPLAHAFAQATDPESLNLQLLRLGYARLLFIGKNRLYETEYKAAETEARKAKRGLWAVSGAGQ